MRTSTEEQQTPAAVCETAFEAAGRWTALNAPASKAQLFDQRAREQAPVFRNNIENYVGTVETPVGIAGPLLVNGGAGARRYNVPLATTEAALVASYNRGAAVLTEAGGCNARVVSEGVSRTPMFAFRNLVEAADFAAYVESGVEQMKARVADVTRYGRLDRVRCVIEGNHVYVDLRLLTGDAAGQNMVTFVADALCRSLLSESPVSPTHWFLEANLSGDKKATTRSLAGVRGKRVIADVTLSRKLVRDRLHTTPERMVDYWIGGALGGVMSGTTGVQGHFANGLAALYLACGQDIACVAESATGITRMELDRNRDLYVSVTLPNIMVGTVGGGTGLPSASACLEILGLTGPGNSRALAEVCGATVLAGEISIIGAFCSGDFARAHHALSRGNKFERSQDDE